MARRTEQVLRRLTRDGAGTLRMLCDDTAEAPGAFCAMACPRLGRRKAHSTPNTGCGPPETATD